MTKSNWDAVAVGNLAIPLLHEIHIYFANMKKQQLCEKSCELTNNDNNNLFKMTTLHSNVKVCVMLQPIITH